MNGRTNTARKVSVLPVQGQKFEAKQFRVFDKESGRFLFGCKADARGLFDPAELSAKLALTYLPTSQMEFLILPKDSAPLVSEAFRIMNLVDQARENNYLTHLHVSPRQKEVLRMVCQNCVNKEIAAKLGITVRTVKFHISSLFAKFDVQDRVELARNAISFKL